MKQIFKRVNFNWNRHIEYLLYSILIYSFLFWIKNKTLVLYKAIDNLNTWNTIIMDNRPYLIMVSIILMGLIFIKIDKNQYMRHFKTPILIIFVLGFLISVIFFPWYISFIFFTLFTIFQLDFSEAKSNNIPIYDSRLEEKKYLENILNTQTNSLILIDGEWGIGKTTFVNSVLSDINGEKIVIDVLLFNTKTHLVEHTLNEIKTILCKAGLSSNNIRKYSSLLKEISEGVSFFNMKMSNLFKEETFSDLEKSIKNDLKYLKKSPYIVLDNLERVLSEEKIIDILGFLHYLYETFNLNIIVLSDTTRLVKKEGKIDRKYLEKFFINQLVLKPARREEIIKSKYLVSLLEENSQINSQILNNVFELLKNNCEKIYEDLEKVKRDLDNKDNRYSNSSKEKIHGYIKYVEGLLTTKIDYSLEIPRNVHRFINNFERHITKENHFNYTDKLAQEEYLAFIGIVILFQTLFEDIYAGKCKYLSISYHPISKLTDSWEKALLKYDKDKVIEIKDFLENQLFMEQFFFLLLQGEKYKLGLLKKEIIENIILNRPSDYPVIVKEKIELMEGNNYIRENSLQILEYFNYYISYIELDNRRNLALYETILSNIENNLTEKDIEEILKSFENNMTLMTLDKTLYQEKRKTIAEKFEKVYFNTYWFNRLLIFSYRDEFLDYIKAKDFSTYLINLNHIGTGYSSITTPLIFVTNKQLINNLEFDVDNFEEIFSYIISSTEGELKKRFSHLLSHIQAVNLIKATNQEFTKIKLIEKEIIKMCKEIKFTTLPHNELAEITSKLFNKLKVLHYFNVDDARDKESEKSGKEKTLEFIKKLPEEVYPIIKMSLSSDFNFYSEFNILFQNVKPYQKD